MKRKLLFVGATLLVASLVFVGCPKDAEPKTTTAEEINASDVESSGASESVSMLKDDNVSNDEIMNLISSAVEDETAMETISNKISDIFSDDTPSANIARSVFRAVTVSDLETEIESISKSFETFASDMTEKGSGSVSYSKELGEITDLDDSGFITLNIPKLSFSADASMSESDYTASANGKIASSAKTTLDFTKLEGLEEDYAVKKVIASAAVDGNGNGKVAMSQTDGSINLTGSISAIATANSGTSLVIPYTKDNTTYNLGGKLIETVTVKVDCSDLSEINISSFMGEEAVDLDEDAIFNLISDYLTVNISVKLYTDDNTEVAELVSISTVDELKEFIEKYSSEVEE